jgi:hypothetical protein
MPNIAMYEKPSQTTRRHSASGESHRTQVRASLKWVPDTE